MTLCIAPHHDDILLSMPSTLSTLSGRPAKVVVVFSVEDSDLERICTGLHRDLSIPVDCLGHVEAVRRGISDRACLRPNRESGAVQADYSRDLDEITSSLGRLLAESPVSEVFVPLMPTHLDHALVRAATESLASRHGIAIVYYEDQPYAALAPLILERETSCLVAAGAVPKELTSGRTVGSVYDELKPVVPHRDVRRILSYRHDVGERFWKQAERAAISPQSGEKP